VTLLFAALPVGTAFFAYYLEQEMERRRRLMKFLVEVHRIDAEYRKQDFTSAQTAWPYFVKLTTALALLSPNPDDVVAELQPNFEQVENWLYAVPPEAASGMHAAMIKHFERVHREVGQFKQYEDANEGVDLAERLAPTLWQTGVDAGLAEDMRRAGIDV